MKKREYLNDRYVAEFVLWASQHLCDDKFAHSYINRRTGQVWSCTSLFDAFKNYDWSIKLTPFVQSKTGVKKGADFSTNAIVLDALSTELKIGISNSNLDRVGNASIEVMTWGGVRPGNVGWLKNAVAHGTLVNTLQQTRTALNSGDSQNPVLVMNDLRFNAGMTKIYSLICDDFIIYDSRVGAALGWMVKKFCDEAGLSTVPPELSFPWAPAKEDQDAINPKCRNPGLHGLKFPRLRSGPMHAQWNMKASWLLEEVLNQKNASACGCFSEVGHMKLRAFEAALFMIGYDLGCGTGTPNKEGEEIEPQWNECFTIAKGTSFRYRIYSDRIETRTERSTGGWKVGPVFTAQHIDAMLSDLRQHFGSSEFPLANSATEVNAGTAKQGLGSSYLKTAERSVSPPDTSKLAVILEEFGVLVPSDRETRRNRRWTIDPGFDSMQSVLRSQIDAEDLV